jgi:hypothetical protein
LTAWGIFALSVSAGYHSFPWGKNRSRATTGENVDIVQKFERALRKKHHSLKNELAKIEHLIDAFEKGAKRGAKRTGRKRISAAGRKRISLAQKARWAKAAKR